MSEPFIGEIKMFGGNFAPRGYAFCEGQLLPISQNTALFSLLGTIYGGDGRTTFALPDLRGRAPIHQGNGPGLSNYQLGQKGGGIHGNQSQPTEVGPPLRSGNVSVLPSGVDRSPYIAINYIIALQGIFPSRS